MLGSSIDRHDRRRRRERLNGVLWGMTEGEAGCPGWVGRFSPEPLLSGMLWSPVEEFWAWAPGDWALSLFTTLGDPTEELAWKSPSEIEFEWRSGALLPSAALCLSLSWHGCPHGGNLRSRRLFSMHMSAMGKPHKTEKMKWLAVLKRGIWLYISYQVSPWWPPRGGHFPFHQAHSFCQLDISASSPADKEKMKLLWSKFRKLFFFLIGVYPSIHFLNLHFLKMLTYIVHIYICLYQ